MGVAGAVMQQRMFEDIGDVVTDSDALGADSPMLTMRKWVPVTMALAVGALVFSTLVLVCAVLVLIWHRSVPKLVPMLLFGTIGYTILQTGISAYSQYDMMSWTRDLGAGAGGGFDGIMGMSLGFSLCVMGGWGFLKIAFYVYAAMHLRRPDVVSLFGGQAPAIGPRGD